VTNPLYDALIVLHVVLATGGFLALGATGAAAAALRRSAAPFSSEQILRFFTPGRNLAARAIFLVPLLGAALLIDGRGRDVHDAWPWMGLGCWAVAAAITSARIWPAEREVQRLVAARAAAAGELEALARRIESGAMATSLLFVAALVVMIAQPG
jgi:hypothetical protein